MKKQIIKLLSDNSFLAMLLPIFSYAIAYAYESGFCAYFHIPYSFITINIFNFMTAFSSLFLFVYIYSIAIIFFYIFNLAILGFIFVGYEAIYLSFINVMMIVIPLFFLYLYVKFIKRETFEIKPWFEEGIVINKSFLSLMSIFIFILLFSNSLGFHNAKIQTKFYLNDEKKYLFLKKYDDIVFLKPYKKGFLLNEIKIINNMEKLDLAYKNIDLKYLNEEDNMSFLRYLFNAANGKNFSKILADKIKSSAGVRTTQTTVTNSNTDSLQDSN